MKRAAVWYDAGRWYVDLYRGRHIPGRAVRRQVLRMFPGPWEHEKPFPTHAAALAHALAEVGLTPTNPEEKS